MKFLLTEGRYLEITIVFPGTPAEKAGLCKGDAIISIHFTNVSTKGSYEKIKYSIYLLEHPTQLSVFRFAGSRRLRCITQAYAFK